MRYFKIELIENFIKENGWSARKFCKECKITMSTCLKILNQQTNFNFNSLFKIAKVMNLQISDLCCHI